MTTTTIEPQQPGSPVQNMESAHQHHAHVATTIRETIEVLFLGDWRTLTRDRLLEGAARLRTVKAQYLLVHGVRRFELSVIDQLDAALTSIYLLLDELDGRDLEQQRAWYQRLREVQSPLLALCVAIPHQPEPPAVPSASQTAEENTVIVWQPTTEPRQRFMWDKQKIAQLKAAYEQSSEKNDTQKIRAIAEQFGWPQKSVEYKIYSIFGTQRTRRDRETAEPAQEDDRRAQ